jgi:F-type H+-transporting ATPase subunit gamma
MESLKQIRARIRSVDNTRKITRAMEMVSIAKLRRIETTLLVCRGYYQALEQLRSRLFASLGKEERHPFLAPAAKSKPAVVCVMTSDTGLCGTYNMAVIRLAHDHLVSLEKKAVIVAVGKKSARYFQKKGFEVGASFPGLSGRYSTQIADAISDKLSDMFLSGAASQITVVHTHYESLSRYRPVVAGILPLEKEKQPFVERILEPSGQLILEELLGRYVKAKMRLLLAESFTAEHASRMTAMKIACDNAKELQEQLILARNKSRQASITKEVIEIISSSQQ